MLGSLPPILHTRKFASTLDVITCTISDLDILRISMHAMPVASMLGKGEVEVALNVVRMECNREEACRSMENAEKKFRAHDLEGSYRFAQKAYRLYPELEGLSQMMVVLEVHIAAETKINGHMDWYSILQVDTFSDHALMKKQYRKLALVLHPDKNRCVGAEGAFKLIVEAWGVLSDKLKRSAYDHMRRTLLQQGLKPSTGCAPTSNVNSPNGYNSSTATHFASVKTPTFWTACSYCKTLHEYSRSYERHTLLCPSCQKSFLAVEVATVSVNDIHGNAERPRKRSSGEKNNDMTEIKINAAENKKSQGKAKKHAKNECQKGKKPKNEPKKPKKATPVHSEDDPSVKIVDPVSMDVQDPDFHDFDQDRTEDSFEANQIWAVYDDDDGMPRYYAFINKVVSLNPFKVQLSWLEGKNNGDQGLSRWLNAGFWQTCGDFKVGRKTTTNFLNVFSHVMRYEKAPGGVVKIFPRKGTVWALYRNWKSDWDKSTPLEVKQKYDMVEVLTDFTEQLGVSVVHLIKLSGFKTLFQKKQLGSQAVQWVLKNELLRFSHQVPAWRLLGNEVPNMPKGCWELDPAAFSVDEGEPVE